MLKLIIEDDEGRKTVVPFMRDEITIGRQEGNTIRLTERNVSRHHARLSRQNGQVLIEDLGSYNGIRVNGDRIAGRVQVEDGDLIQIGDYDLAVQAEEPVTVATAVPLKPELLPPLGVPPGSDSAATVRALPLVPDTPPAPLEGVRDRPPPAPATLPERSSSQATETDDEADDDALEADLSPTGEAELSDLDLTEAPRLVAMSTELAGKEYPCLRTELTIGRDEANDVTVDHRSLSRVHCRLVREGSGEWRIMDLESSNGLRVNGEAYSQVTLHSRDIVELGLVKLQFLLPGDEPTLERPRAARASRAPLYAVLSAAVVIVVGLGGYALWKGSASLPPLRDVALRPVSAPSTARPAPSAPAAEQAARRLEQALDEAKGLLDVEAWDEAERLLRTCTVDGTHGGALDPRADELLAQLATDRRHQAALDDAERFLALGDLAAAKRQLDVASDTVRYEDRLALLAERLRHRPAARPAAAPRLSGSVTGPALVPSKAKLDDAARLADQGRRFMREEQLDQAALVLARCTSQVPTYADCHKLHGSVMAKIALRDGRQGAYNQARASYQRFLQLAPADDPDVPKVKRILEAAQEGQ